MPNQIQTHTFPNGFRVIYEPPDNHMDIAHINVFCRVGSAFEPANLRGVSHFIEHMCFKGTRHLPTTRDIVVQYDSVGAYLNANTNKQYTCYIATVHNEYAQNSIAILGDMMMNSVFDKKEFEKEMNVVIEENKRNLTDFEGEMKDLVDSMVYRGSVYAQPVDSMKFHKTTDVWKYDNVIDFYHKYYVPENMMLSITTTIPFATILRYLKKTEFVRWASSRKCVIPPIVNPHKTMIYDRQTEIQAEMLSVRTIETAYIGIAFRTCSVFSNDIHALNLLSSILGSGLISRLYTTLRENNGLTYTSNVSTNYYENTGHILFYAITDSNKILYNKTGSRNRTQRKGRAAKKGVYPLVLDLISDLVKKGVSEKEVAIVKKHIKGKRMRGLEDAGNQVFYNGCKWFLKEEEHFSSYKDNHEYAAVRREEINAMIAKYFKPENMSIAMVGGDLPNVNLLKRMAMEMW